MSLTTTEIADAHKMALSHVPGGWIACFEPERVMDPLTVFVGECPRCRVAAEAYLRMHGDNMGTNTERDGTRSTVILSEWLDEMEQKYG